MNTHSVSIKGSAIRHNFSIEGLVDEISSNLLWENIDRFYDTINGYLLKSGAERSFHVSLNKNGGNYFLAPDMIRFNPLGLTDWTVTHELSHALDGSTGWILSRKLRQFTHSRFPLPFIHRVFPSWKSFWYRVGCPPPPCGVDRNFNALEDFAESLTAFIFPQQAHQRAEARGYAYERWGFNHFHETPRGKFIQELVMKE